MIPPPELDEQRVAIITGASHLDWLNKGVFISVAGRQTAGVIYETYLVE